MKTPYRKLGKTNKEVSLIGFGALEIGRDWGLGKGEDTMRPDEEAASALLHDVLDCGINLIDTARAYHRSEERIGQSISRRRSEYFLASKCGEHSREPETYYDFSYQAVADSIDLSLKLLKTESIDLMQIHFGPDAEKALHQGEVIQAMLDARAAGKISYLGASAWGDLAVECIETGHFDVMQLAYNLIQQEDEPVIKLCQEKNIGVLIRTPLALGKLTPKGIQNLNTLSVRERSQLYALLELVNNDAQYIPALALQFLSQHPGISSILVGTKNEHHLRDNIKALSASVSDDIIKKAMAIGRDI